MRGMIQYNVLALTCFLLIVLSEAGAPNANASPVLKTRSDTVHLGDVFTLPISVSDVLGAVKQL